MAFFGNVKNIVFTLLITALSATLIAVSVVFAIRGARINDAYVNASSELAIAKESLAAVESEKNSISAELENEKQERERLEKENAGLKNEITQLKAKKAEEEAKQLALKQQQQAQTTQPKPPATKVCYLTFDDGPCQYTPQILEILARYNAKATFFVVGNSEYLDYVNDINRAGHSVGLHTNTHVYKQLYANDDAYFFDLNAVSAAVEQRIGNVKIIRFPGGSSNTVSKKYCSGIMTRLSQSVTAKGYAYFDWNVDSGDAAGKSVQGIIDSVISQASRKSGAVCVLMHDNKANTLKALPSLIEGLIGQGFYFEPLTVDSYGFHHGINN